MSRVRESAVRAPVSGAPVARRGSLGRLLGSWCRSVAAGLQHIGRRGEVAGVHQDAQGGVKHPHARLHAVHVHAVVLLDGGEREGGTTAAAAVSGSAQAGCVLRRRRLWLQWLAEAAARRACNARRRSPRPRSPRDGRFGQGRCRGPARASAPLPAAARRARTGCAGLWRGQKAGLHISESRSTCCRAPAPACIAAPGCSTRGRGGPAVPYSP